MATQESELARRVQAQLDQWRARQAAARPHGTDWRQARDIVEQLEELLAPNPPGGVIG